MRVYTPSGGSGGKWQAAFKRHHLLPLQGGDADAVKRADSEEDSDEEEEKQAGGLSKKKAKQQSRMAIAALKQVQPLPLPLPPTSSCASRKLQPDHP